MEGALNVKLVPGEYTKYWRHHISEPAVRDHFYLGMSHFYRFTEADNLTARRAFQEVCRVLPDSHLGPTYIAVTHWMDGFRRWNGPVQQSLDAAQAWAEKATEFDDLDDGQVYIVLGHIHLLNRKHVEALAEIEKAFELRPSCPQALGHLANILHYCGRSREAVSRMKEAIRHSPLYPPWFIDTLAAAYREMGDVGRSITVAKDALQLNPREPRGVHESVQRQHAGQ